MSFLIGLLTGLVIGFLAGVCVIGLLSATGYIVWNRGS